MFEEEKAVISNLRFKESNLYVLFYVWSFLAIPINCVVDKN